MYHFSTVLLRRRSSWHNLIVLLPHTGRIYCIKRWFMVVGVWPVWAMRAAPALGHWRRSTVNLVPVVDSYWTYTVRTFIGCCRLLECGKIVLSVMNFRYLCDETISPINICPLIPGFKVANSAHRCNTQHAFRWHRKLRGVNSRNTLTTCSGSYWPQYGEVVVYTSV
jgi:hypothetical protein